MLFLTEILGAEVIDVRQRRAGTPVVAQRSCLHPARREQPVLTPTDALGLAV
jgi:hypothetical protein